VERYLVRTMLRASAVEDHDTAIQALTALPVLSHMLGRQFSDWRMNYTLDWRIIQRALDSGTVDDAQWERLLDVLTWRRSPMEMVVEMVRFSRLATDHLGVWPIPGCGTPDPVLSFGYLQNWAYIYITTPLYNHDIARFSRAMIRLLDLSR
jgi:hypothetical protein